MTLFESCMETMEVMRRILRDDEKLLDTLMWMVAMKWAGMPID